MVKLFYHDSFNLERESITLRKYRLVKDKLLNENVINKEDVITPKPITAKDLLLAHTKEYIDAVRNGEPKPLAESNGIKWGEDVYERAVYSLGSVYQSLESALRDGISGSLSSGYHHAHKSHGKGFCTFNYVVPIRKLMQEGKIENALILDCDVHHPDGTEDCINGDERIVSLSINGTSNFKNKNNKISFGLSLPEGVNYFRYESILENLMEEAISKQKPSIILYKASQDSHKDDPFGNLKFNTQELFERDKFVFRYAKSKGIPISFIIGSGYTRPIDISVNGHVNTVKASKEVKAENIKVIDYDNPQELSVLSDEMSKDIEGGRIYFVEKLTSRLDRMSGHNLCVGKVFNPHSQTYFYDINNNWSEGYCLDSCGLSVLSRNLINEEEFIKNCNKIKVPSDIQDKAIQLGDKKHLHKELGSLITLSGPMIEN